VNMMRFESMLSSFLVRILAGCIEMPCALLTPAWVPARRSGLRLELRCSQVHDNEAAKYKILLQVQDMDFILPETPAIEHYSSLFSGRRRTCGIRRYAVVR